MSTTCPTVHLNFLLCTVMSRPQWMVAYYINVIDLKQNCRKKEKLMKHGGGLEIEERLDHVPDHTSTTERNLYLLLADQCRRSYVVG